MTAQQQKQQNLTTVRKCRLNLWVAVALVLALSLVKLFLANRSATWGQELEDIETQTQKIKAENDQLRLALNQHEGGLTNLKEKAGNLGFVEKPQYLYLSGPENVAQKLP